jgi:hypothetical protein
MAAFSFLFLSNTSLQKRFTILVVLLCLGYYALEWFNGRAQMADFRVYYDAASALMHGDVVYGKAFGVSSGFYKYSPFACIPFIPLALLPYPIASGLYYLVTTAAIVFFSLRISTYISGSASSLRLPILTGLFLMDHLERELHLGNVNLLLLIALFELYLLLSSGKERKAGMLYGVVLLFKPHFILLLPYLLWKRRAEAAAVTGLTLLTGLLLPTVGLGWHGNAQLIQQWLSAMSDHNLALQKSPNTLYGLLNTCFFHGQAGGSLVILTLAAVVGFYVYKLYRNDRSEGQTWSRSIRFSEFFLLVALVPNLVHTDTEHFMWVWPLLAFTIHAAMQPSLEQRNLIIGLLVLAFIPFALNSPDIVGRDVQRLFDEGGLGLANIVLLTAFLLAERTPFHHNS